MSRRRYVSSDISLDPAVNRVGVVSDFAALLYTWMIPHAKDDATISGDPDRILLEVVPGRRDKTASDIIEALEFIEAEGLFEWWDRETMTIYFDPESFYKYQTYIKPCNRRAPLDNAEERRKTPKNTASLSLSLSPSNHLSDKSDSNESKSPSYPSDFLAFWDAYPRREKKGDALRAWKVVRKHYDAETIIAGIEPYKASEKVRAGFVQLPATWLRARCWEDESIPFIPADDGVVFGVQY